ncbi:GGDEF domain-containing protein [Paucisalibacillus globulus]|jgi:diguanylate cyclase|uniref:GGDEF domain-containing protein n=1 Tax=Paucisalibacillus globulus TaxID=351095 RepID=UPI000BB8FE6B|nr:GGDEF domain-containing protein [Paucisalibacillus globulus]
MNNKEVINTHSLIRDILNILWMGVGLYIIGTSTNLIFTTYDKWLFVKEIMVPPTIQFIMLMVILEFLYTKKIKHLEYWLLVIITIIIDVIIYGLQTLTMALLLLIVPVLISLYFYKTKLLTFAFYMAIISFLSIYIFSDSLRPNMKHSEFIFIIAMLIGITLLLYKLIKHSYQLANQLIETEKEKQDLFSKNIHMERLTRVDAVTNLYNHRSFHEHLKSIFAFKSPEKFSVHVAILDIDNFKSINDTYGHRAGDHVIIEVAKLIESHMVGDDFPSRYGGEEFAIISIGPSTEEFIQKLERIRKAISNLSFSDLDGKMVTVSIGVQNLVAGMNKEQLFKGADSALYQAKNSGKNKTIFNTN